MAGFDYDNTFGTPTACACEDCTSIYSPAAYLADSLQFLQSAEQDQLFGPITRKSERKPIVRRPDLKGLQLSCINTNTPMPYIDLVNEILEWAVTTDGAGSPPNGGWPQTTATVDSLRLTPEHMIDGAYDLVARSTMSFALPFDLASVSARRFLGLVGVNRDELLEAFLPQAPSGVDRRVAADILGMSADEYALISSPMPTVPVTAVSGMQQTLSGLALANGRSAADGDHVLVMGQDNPIENGIYLAHAGAWTRAPEMTGTLKTGVQADLGNGMRFLLGVLPPLNIGTDPVYFAPGLSVVIKRLEAETGLDFPTLQTVFGGKFLSDLAPGSSYSVKMGTPETCNLSDAVIDPDPDPYVFDRLARFLRLQRRLGWSFHALDLALSCIGATDLDDGTLRDLAVIERLRRRLKLPIFELLSWFGKLDTALDDDGTLSLYARVFQDQAVLAPDAIAAFALNADNSELAITAKKLADFTSVLVGVLRTTNTQIASVLATATSDSLNLTNVSLLYRYASLARALRWTIADVLALRDLSGLDPFGTDATGPSSTYAFIDAALFVKASGRTLAELGQILSDNFTVNAAAARDRQVATILGELGAALAKTSDDPADAQRTLAVQKLSAALKLDPTVVDALLASLPSNAGGGKLASDDLTDGTLAADPTTATNAIATTKVLLKLAMLFRWLKITADRLKFVDSTGATVPAWLVTNSSAHGWLDLTALPTASSPAAATFTAYRRMAETFRFWDRFVTSSDSLYFALTAKDRDTYAQQLYTLAQTPSWSQDDVAFLVGSTGQLAADDPTAAPNFATNGAFGNGAILGRVALCVSFLRLLGVPAKSAVAWLDLDPADQAHLAHARQLRQAVKSQFDRTTWATVSLPVQDALRTQQRDALVAYVCALRAFPNPDALYEHFLIDVQMGDCMITSRIKQAIGTVQLFIQRALMNLEDNVAIDSERAQQWRTWRSSITIWTANRKIFLYPENWIQASLRVDKTPLFDTFMSAIRQRQITADAAEEILDTYLTSLDDVGRLRVIGFWRDDDTDTRHVVARTLNVGHIHYYRQILNASDPKGIQFTPWERLDVDISGDHLLPVIYHRRLHLFWPIFAVKPDSNLDQGLNSSVTRRLEVQLAWTERKSGKWTPKRMTSKPVISRRDPAPIDTSTIWTNYQLQGDAENDTLTITVDWTTKDASENDDVQEAKGTFVFQSCASVPVTNNVADSGDWYPSIPDAMEVDFNGFLQEKKLQPFIVPETFGKATLLNQVKSSFRILPGHQDLPFAGQTDFFLDDADLSRVFFARCTGTVPPVKNKYVDWQYPFLVSHYMKDPQITANRPAVDPTEASRDIESIPLVANLNVQGVVS